MILSGQRQEDGMYGGSVAAGMGGKTEREEWTDRMKVKEKERAAQCAQTWVKAWMRQIEGSRPSHFKGNVEDTATPTKHKQQSS